MSGAWLTRIGITLAVALAVAPAHAADPQRAPRPGWVQPLAVDFEQTRAEERSGDAFTVLFDSRVRLSGKQQQRYERRVRKALTSAGVDRLAEVLVQFDPEQEQLVLHGIELHRGAQLIDQTSTARVRLVAEESELERRMYNGAVTAFVVLSDVRVGDAIDLSYSLIGADPVLEGRYAGGFSLSTSEVVRRRHVEVVTDGARTELRTKLLGQPVAAGKRETSATSWDLFDVAPRTDEDRVAAPYEYSRLQLSEFGSWRDVAAWGARLYPVLAPSKDVEAQAAALSAGAGDPEEVALRILRFVQDDVRYLAISNEGHGLSPHAPDKVLAQRFGDCKDKTYLLQQLLAARGIAARPMLVHSDNKGYVLEYEPSPYAFDHVILRATIAGKVHYLDATYAQQGGTLATQAGLDYGYGLVLEPDTTGLEAIPFKALSSPSLRSRTEVRVESSGSARLDVTTQYSDSEADAKRSSLSRSSLSEISEQLANYYQREFIDVDVVEPLSVRDDRRANSIVATEHYRVRQFWREGARWLYAAETDGYLKLPNVVRRTLPLHLSHPVWVQESFAVELPFMSELEDRYDSVADDALMFSRDIKETGTRVLVTFNYRSLGGSVPSAKASEHFHMLQRAREWNGFNLSGDDAPQVSSHRRAADLKVLLTTFGVIAGLVALVFAWPAAKRARAWLRKRRFARSQRGSAGETPAQPALAASLHAAELMLSKTRCSCGQRLFDDPIEWSMLRFEGGVLHAARSLCGTCGQPARRYFNVPPEP